RLRPRRASPLFPYTTLFRSVAVTQRTVQVRVFDVNRVPEITASNHALLVGESFDLAVVRGDAQASAGAVRVVDADGAAQTQALRSEEHTSELQSRENLVCRL